LPLFNLEVKKVTAINARTILLNSIKRIKILIESHFALIRKKEVLICDKFGIVLQVYE